MIEIRITGEAQDVLRELRTLLADREHITIEIDSESEVAKRIGAAAVEPGPVAPPAELFDETPKKKPGRPRGSGKKTPPVTEAGDPVSAPQEAVGNTSSVPAGHTPPAEGAQEEAAGPGLDTQAGQPVASPVTTQDDVRAKLKAVSEKLGMPATIKIIEDLGYDGAKSKVKDIREEHYAAVIAAADKVLAA